MVIKQCLVGNIHGKLSSYFLKKIVQIEVTVTSKVIAMATSIMVKDTVIFA